MGTPHSEAEDPIVVARVIGPHGRHGGLNIQLLSDRPGRFDVGRDLLVDGRTYAISESRQTGPDTALICLEGVTGRRDASAFSGKFLAANHDGETILEEGEYFHYQLIGMEVRTEGGERLGELQEILETGSNDVYIVRGGDAEVLIPAMAQVVIEVDVGARTMLVRLPDGLR